MKPLFVPRRIPALERGLSAYEAMGWQTRMEGRSIKACPYDPGTDSERRWCEGWRKAQLAIDRTKSKKWLER